MLLITIDCQAAVLKIQLYIETSCRQFSRVDDRNHLIRLHFRLTVSHADSLAASLYKYRLSQTSLSIPQASYTTRW